MSAKIIQALLAVMDEVSYVQKTGRVSHAGANYSYASDADVIAVVRPSLVKFGLALIGPIAQGDARLDEHGITWVKVGYRLVHNEGDMWPDLLIVEGCGQDRNSKGVGDKGLSKAYTAAGKTVLLRLLILATGDEAGAGNGAPPEKPVTKAQLGAIVKAMKRVGWTSPQALTWARANCDSGIREATDLTEAEGRLLLSHLNTMPPVAEEVPA